jgi:hypothetical protein
MMRHLPRKAAEQACLDCDEHLMIAGEPVYQRDVDRFGEMTSGAEWSRVDSDDHVPVHRGKHRYTCSE